MCRGSAAHEPAADARDKPEHDGREVGRHCQQSQRAPKRPSITCWFSSPSTGTDASALPRARPLR
ncbi:hypothetical protein GFL49_17635 [Rhizobium leguminosarum bv. viciae]|nr:hypothetical protein [Rhizobium leguminosarum bv. viciae]